MRNAGVTFPWSPASLMRFRRTWILKQRCRWWGTSPPHPNHIWGIQMSFLRRRPRESIKTWMCSPLLGAMSNDVYGPRPLFKQSAQPISEVHSWERWAAAQSPAHLLRRHPFRYWHSPTSSAITVQVRRLLMRERSNLARHLRTLRRWRARS